VEDFLKARLDRMEAVLADKEWLAAGQFTVADLRWPTSSDRYIGSVGSQCIRHVTLM